MPKLLYLVSNDQYFCTHRLNLATAAVLQGYEVAVATRCSGKDKESHNGDHIDYSNSIEEKGIKIFPLQFYNRSGINPFRQMLTLYELYKIYQAFKPDIVHHVAIKPVLLGSFIAKLCKVPKIINALGGLGYLFIEQSEKISGIPLKGRSVKKGILRLVSQKLFKWVFSQPNSILILQNKDDLETLKNFGCIEEKKREFEKLTIKSKPSSDPKIVIIPGSGIDTKAYALVPPPLEPPIVITCVSRMLWDKGIGELVGAARILQEKLKSDPESNSKIKEIKVILYGTPDPQNPASIPEDVLREWHTSGIIEWKGYCNDVAKAYAECHIAVLPSYREGLPKSLLEAASCGKPIVTTDVPGCREVVREGENGFLVPAYDSEKLADCLFTLVQSETLRDRMGIQGRKRMEELFSEDIIHESLLKLYEPML